MKPRDQTLTLNGADGQPIRADVYLPDRSDGVPIVVVVHGFKGFKDWGCFPWIARTLANQGLATVCMNLSHCGVAEDPETFERLDLFERDTWSKRLFDMNVVLSAIESETLISDAAPNPSRVGLLGHSMGGGLAILTAAKDLRVQSMATLASVNRPNRIEQHVDEQLATFGHVKVMNGRTGQEMRIGRDFFDEVRTHPEAFDILKAASIVRQPWLLVHGSDDETVPLSEAHSLLDAANNGPNQGEKVKMLVVEETGHTFGARHPFSGPNQHLEQAIDVIASHFLATL